MKVPVRRIVLWMIREKHHDTIDAQCLSYRDCTPSETIDGEASRHTNPAISTIRRNILQCDVVLVLVIGFARYRIRLVCSMI
jgi:hypothetical protein